MLPPPEKILPKRLKILKTIFSTFISPFYVHMPSFCENPIFFVSCVKTTKISHATSILAPAVSV
jgi:hypothetical protein